MKMKEILQQKNEFFQTYERLYQSEYEQLFNTMNTVFLDKLFFSLCSEKSLVCILENSYIDCINSDYSIQTVLEFMAFYLHSNYEKLLQVKNVFMITNDFLVSNKETYTENASNTQNNEYENTQENVNKNYGYDSENGVNDNSSHYTDNNLTTLNTENEKVYTKNVQNGITNELKDKELKRLIVSDSYLLNMLHNVIDIFTVAVYEG